MFAAKSDIKNLVEACREGHEFAFKTLYEKYVNAMYSTALRIVNDHATAEDKVQEAFVKAFKGINDLSEPAKFGAWLKRIVVNGCLNELKQSARNQLISGDVPDAEQDVHPSAYPDLTVEQVRQAIGQLPDGYRVVLSLYLLENYSHDEIAQQLNISSSTSRTQYMRARTKLRTHLNRKYGQEE